MKGAGATGGRKSCWISEAFLTSQQGSVLPAEPAELGQDAGVSLLRAESFGTRGGPAVRDRGLTVWVACRSCPKEWLQMSTREKAGKCPTGPWHQEMGSTRSGLKAPRRGWRRGQSQVRGRAHCGGKRGEKEKKLLALRAGPSTAPWAGGDGPTDNSLPAGPAPLGAAGWAEEGRSLPATPCPFCTLHPPAASARGAGGQMLHSLLFLGAGQEGAMFVHTRSYEDLTSPEDGAAVARSPEERRGEPAEPTSMEQISKDFSELSTQLTGMALDLEEEMRQNKEGKLEPSPQTARRDSVLSGKEEEDVTMDAWRMHRKHVFVLSEAGKPVYSRYGSEEALSSTMGVMMALVSFLEAEKNAIRSIHAGTALGGMGWGGVTAFPAVPLPLWVTLAVPRGELMTVGGEAASPSIL